MTTPLQRTLEHLASHFARQGWSLAGEPLQVLAMAQQPAAAVEHLLFITEPWGEASGDPRAQRLACTVNVHFPTLEALINEALARDPRDAGRQSLRLALARLAPAAHLVDGGAHEVRPRAAGEAGLAAATQQLRRDVDTCLEPVRRRLCSLDVLAHEPPPPTVDPWTWHLRQAAYLQLHGEAPVLAAFLARLQAQAEQQLAETAGSAEADGHVVAPLAPQQRVRRAAQEALDLVEALRRPRRRVIPLAGAA